jgi:hypothetical protein
LNYPDLAPPTTKERLEALEAEKAQLESMTAEVPLPSLHPNLAQLYHDKIVQIEKPAGSIGRHAPTGSVARVGKVLRNSAPFQEV